MIFPSTHWKDTTAMGGLTSKHVEETVSDNEGTPKRTHILEVDPRSPSDDITRTPIAVRDPGGLFKEATTFRTIFESLLTTTIYAMNESG